MLSSKCNGVIIIIIIRKYYKIHVIKYNYTITKQLFTIMLFFIDRFVQIFINFMACDGKSMYVKQLYIIDNCSIMYFILYSRLFFCKSIYLFVWESWTVAFFSSNCAVLPHLWSYHGHVHLIFHILLQHIGKLFR